MKIFKKHSSSGFAVLEVLAFVIILGLIGFVGWYVMDSKKETNERLDNLSKSTDNTGASSQPTSKASEKFVFKELNMQITLSDSLEGLSYEVDKEFGYNYLTTEKFKTALKPCGYSSNSASDLSFASLVKMNGQYPAEPTIDDGQLVKQFKDFYVGMGVPNGGYCNDAEKAEQLRSMAGELQSALMEAFKTATLVE